MLGVAGWREQAKNMIVRLKRMAALVRREPSRYEPCPMVEMIPCLKLKGQVILK
jgi:hypothetical protein